VKLNRATRRGQRGAMFLILAILIVTALSAMMLNPGSAAQRDQQRAHRTALALAQAKEALLAWSMARPDTGPADSRPGELPCPDTNNDGTAEAACNAGQVGRLPWRTLGLHPLVDGDDEALWYAVGTGFRSATQDLGALNSDRVGALQLYDATGNLVATGPSALAAVIIAPGRTLGGQGGRPSNAAADYLEAALGRDNRTVGGPYLSGPVVTNGDRVLNDVILGVSAHELIAAAERRALAEAQRALDAYTAANPGRLPNAAAPAHAQCLAVVNNVGATVPCPALAGQCIGRLPEDVLLPHAAAWFSANAWGRVLTYAVRNDMPPDASGPECSATLNVAGTAARAVLLAPGSARTGQARPSASLTNYLDDAANSDAWTLAAGQPSFAAPSVGNDQIRSRP
jgi:type II secretory pathway pseudopilin PulG